MNDFFVSYLQKQTCTEIQIHEFAYNTENIAEGKCDDLCIIYITNFL